MNRTHLSLAAAVFALSFTACDDKKPPDPTPIAPVEQAVVPPAAPVEPAKPAEPAEAPHAAAAVKAEAKQDSETPDIAPPKTADAPAEMKGKEEKGLKNDGALAEKRLGAKMPPPPPAEAPAPAAAPATTEVQPAKAGRKLPPGVQ
jgi:hypothetical protein